MATISIIQRVSHITKSGEAPIYIQIIKDRKSNLIKTGLKIKPEDWDAKKQRVKPKNQNSTRFNLILDEERLKANSLLLAAKSEKRELSGIDVKNILTGSVIGEHDFFSFSNLILERYLANNQFANHDKNKAILQKLIKFHGKPTLSFESLNLSYMKRYENYLRTDLLNKSNTIINSLKFFKKVLNCAIQEGFTKHNGLENYSIPKEPTKITYLNQEEVNRIEELKYPIESKSDVHKDIFLFMAQSGGLRISDTLLLKWSDIYDDKIHIQIHKTKKQLALALTQKGKLIIEKYRLIKNNNVFVFPLLPNGLNISNLKEVDLYISRATSLVNKSLKSIAQEAQIKKRLTCHVGRHAWSMYALPKIGLKALSQILGHSSVRETEVYARIEGAGLDDLMKTL